MLGELGIETPYEDGKGVHVYHQYTILTDKRETIQKALAAANIASAVYYPVPLHKQDVFAEDCKGMTLPVTERVAARVLSLPIFPELTNVQVEQVVAVIGHALKS